MISYKPLFHTLVNHGMRMADLRRMVGGSSSTFAKLQRGEPIALTVLERICLALGCEPGDVIEFVPSDTPASSSEGDEAP